MDENKILSEREIRIFLELLTYYIHNSEPVGSRTLSKKLSIELSPATIRNIMADLEEKGFLTHPHTSAGRIPTEKGYRFFVDHLMACLKREAEPLGSQKNLESILSEIRERAAMLSKISSILSALSKYVGIVLAPKVSQLTLKHIDFVHMGGHNCLAIFVTQSGLLFNRMVDTEEIIPQELLDKMSRYVNHQFQGLNLSEIKAKIFQIMSDEKTLYDQFVRQSIQLSEKAINDNEEICDVYLDGRQNILDQPEFADPHKMRSFFDTVEEKGRLIKIMDQYQAEDGVKVLIGSENPDPQMVDCSLVMSTYRIRPQVRGMLGVIGPTRMRYREVISMVDQMAIMMTRIFQQMH